MVTKKVIHNLYRKYNKPPKSADELDIATLFERAADNHGLVIDEDKLYIGSVDPASPFSEIPLGHIHAIVEFDNVVAIVLGSSIVFLEKYGDGVNVHLKLDGPSLWDRLRMAKVRESDFTDTPVARFEDHTPASNHVAMQPSMLRNIA